MISTFPNHSIPWFPGNLTFNMFVFRLLFTVYYFYYLYVILTIITIFYFSTAQKCIFAVSNQYSIESCNQTLKEFAITKVIRQLNSHPSNNLTQLPLPEHLKSEIKVKMDYLRQNSYQTNPFFEESIRIGKRKRKHPEGMEMDALVKKMIRHLLTSLGYEWKYPVSC